MSSRRRKKLNRDLLKVLSREKERKASNKLPDLWKKREAIWNSVENKKIICEDDNWDDFQERLSKTWGEIRACIKSIS